MASLLRVVGIAGAVLILVGAAIGGIGFINASTAESASVTCGLNPPAQGCRTVEENAANASVQEELFLGIGLVAGGIGVGLVFSAAISFMSRWPPGSPPPSLFLPPLAPPGPPRP